MDKKRGWTREQIGIWLVLLGLPGLVAPWLGAAVATAGLMVLAGAAARDGLRRGGRIAAAAGAVIVLAGTGLSVADMLSILSLPDFRPMDNYVAAILMMTIMNPLYWTGVMNRHSMFNPKPPTRFEAMLALALGFVLVGVAAGVYWNDWDKFAFFAWMATACLLTSSLVLRRIHRRPVAQA